MNSPITVILVDDHALVRDTLAEWLNALPDIRVLETCADAEQAVEAVRRCRPDVVVLDIDMPGRLVFDAARSIVAESPHTRLVFLSAFCSDRFISQAIEVKAAAYLTKGESPKTVAHAIRNVRDGLAYFSDEVRKRMVVGPTGVRLGTETSTRFSKLSARELEVLRYLARAMSRKEIAQVMRLSVHTVDRHTANLMNKLDIHNRAELCRFAIREGLAEA